MTSQLLKVDGVNPMKFYSIIFRTMNPYNNNMKVVHIPDYLTGVYNIILKVTSLTKFTHMASPL